MISSTKSSLLSTSFLHEGTTTFQFLLFFLTSNPSFVRITSTLLSSISTPVSFFIILKSNIMSLLDNSKSLEYIDHYCNDASYKKNLAKNTLEAYKSDLTVFLKWLVSRNHDLLHVDRILINNCLLYTSDAADE